MVTEIRIYFEGDESLRRGFHQFFQKIRDAARQSRCGFRPIACGARAARDFDIAKRMHPQACNILLVDMENPTGTAPPNVFWMVQLMEAWFLADPDSLSNYYGQGFQASAKQDVYNSLRQATRSTRKGRYHKTRHAPDLLAMLDAARVRTEAPNCERLFQHLLSVVGRADR
jgi:hypothetical protein